MIVSSNYGLKCFFLGVGGKGVTKKSKINTLTKVINQKLKKALLISDLEKF
jgi:hypothetical protein